MESYMPSGENILQDGRIRYDKYFKDYFEGIRHFQVDDNGYPIEYTKDLEGEMYYCPSEEETRDLQNYCENDPAGEIKFIIDEKNITLRFKDFKRNSTYSRVIKISKSNYKELSLEPIEYKYKVITNRYSFTKTDILDKLEKIFIEKAYRYQNNRAPNKNHLWAIHYPIGITEVIILKL